MSNIRPNGDFNPDHNPRFLPDSYTEEYQSFLLYEGDLVIAMTDMAGEPKILGLPTLVGNLNGRSFLMNQRVGKLFDFSDDIYIPYLRYYLSSPIIKEYYKSKGAGGLQINISKKDVLSAEIPLPPIPEQRRIVELLDSVFADLEKTRAKTEQNLKNARELFDSCLQQAFCSKDRSWVNNKLGDVCNIVGGGTPSKSNDSFYGGNIPWATVRDMRNDILTSTQLSITEDAVKQSSTNLIPSGAIITATRVGLGKVCILNQDTAINQDLKAFIPKDEKLDNTFLYWWLKSIAHIIVSAGTGATVQGVKLTFVKSLDIPLPLIPEQNIIASKLSVLSENKAQLERLYQNKLLAIDELKKSILQKAFSGELTHD